MSCLDEVELTNEFMSMKECKSWHNKGVVKLNADGLVFSLKVVYTWKINQLHGLYIEINPAPPVNRDTRPEKVFMFSVVEIKRLSVTNDGRA